MQNAFFYTSPDDINGDDGDDGDDNTQQSPPSERSSCSYMQGTDSISSNSVFSGHSIQSYNHSSHSTSSTSKELSYTKRRKAIHYLQCQQARKKRIPYRIPEMDVVEFDTCYKYYIDLPCIRREDLKISFLKDSILVDGQRILRYENCRSVLLSNRLHGFFHFKIPYNSSVMDIKSATACLDSGVLCITISKRIKTAYV